jgi:hypothetical protein
MVEYQKLSGPLYTPPPLADTAKSALPVRGRITTPVRCLSLTSMDEEDPQLGPEDLPD